MGNKQLPAIAKLNQQIAPTYRHAAQGLLEWSQEKAFLEAQVKRNRDISAAVRNNVAITIDSLKLAVRECASMGLSMSPAASLVYFIPRKIRKPRQGESANDVPIVVTASPSYRGLSYIATHYAGAKVVAAEVVYQADKFRYLGPIEKPVHEPTLDNSQRNERAAIGAYAVVVMQDGSVRCEYTDAPTIQKIRQLSEVPNSMMWTTLWTEGWRKVPIRRICKTVMVSDARMEVAVTALDRLDAPNFDDDPDDPAPTNEPPKRGMAGLGAAMERQQEPAEPIEGEVVTSSLADPAPCDHPPGSIEWWCHQIRDASTPERLTEIRDAAMDEKVDQSDDADTFRNVYSARHKTLKTEEAA